MTTASELALSPKDTAVLIIDVQERLCAAMPEGGAACIKNAGILVDGAAVLGVPVLVTEQYPKGLGHTVPALREKIDAAKAPVFEKVEFAAPANPAFQERLDALVAGGVRSVVVAGMEAHICVYQSVRALADRGLRVHVASDATCSRSADNAAVARDLWKLAGATVSSTETVLFDLLGAAGTDAFRTISRLVR